MEATRCKSCGGVLQKVSVTDYRCTFCGTVHRLTLDDAKSVDALMDQNNARWLSINRSMQNFFTAINQAAGHHEKYNGHRARTVAFAFAGLVVFGILFISSHTSAAPGVTMPSPAEMANIGSFWGTLVVVVVAVSLLLAYSERKMRDRAMTGARGVLAEVLATYRTMSTRPAGELLATLHNANLLFGERAEAMASQVYEQVIVADRSPQA